MPKGLVLVFVVVTGLLGGCDQPTAKTQMSPWVIIGPVRLVSNNDQPIDEIEEKAFKEDVIDIRKLSSLELPLHRGKVTGKDQVVYNSTLAPENATTVDLGLVTKTDEREIAYALKDIYLSEATDVVFGFGFDDSGMVWINGEKLFEKFTKGPVVPGQYSFHSSLKKGKNRIVVKIQNRGGDWGFDLAEYSTKQLLDKLVQAIQQNNLDAVHVLKVSSLDLERETSLGLSVRQAATVWGSPAVLQELGIRPTPISELPSTKYFLEHLCRFQFTNQRIGLSVAAKLGNGPAILYTQGFLSVSNPIPVDESTAFPWGEAEERVILSLYVTAFADTFSTTEDIGSLFGTIKTPYTVGDLLKHNTRLSHANEIDGEYDIDHIIPGPREFANYSTHPQPSNLDDLILIKALEVKTHLKYENLINRDFVNKFHLQNTFSVLYPKMGVKVATGGGIKHGALVESMPLKTHSLPGYYDLVGPPKDLIEFTRAAYPSIHTYLENGLNRRSNHLGTLSWQTENIEVCSSAGAGFETLVVYDPEGNFCFTGMCNVVEQAPLSGLSEIAGLARDYCRVKGPIP